MFNGRKVGHALTGLGMLCVAAGIVLIVEHCTACTPTQRAAIKEAGDFARDVHQCRILNPNRTAMSLCMAGVAMRYAGENLDEPLDAGSE